MGKYKNLLNNSIIFAIGNLGTKTIVMLLVPLYTYTLTTAEYGTADLITSIINLSLPVASLSIFEATLRFVMDKSMDQLKILNSALAVTGAGSLLIVFVLIFVNFLFKEQRILVNYLSIILILQMFQTLFAQYLRGIGKVKIFAANGILNAVILAVSNLLFLFILKMKIDGYFLSIIFANFISNIFLLAHIDVKKIFSYRKIDTPFIKYMLNYSIPLIPNSLMWWIVNTSSRYFILFFSGVEANGLFAVSAKIPSIITIFQSIFFQAWQLSAIDEFNNKERNKFYQQVFNVFSCFMFLITAIVILFIKPIIYFAVSSAYYLSWKYVPFLLIGVLFSSFSSFMGTLYVASKETNEIMKSSFIGALANILTCLILVPKFGANGAAIASAFSFIFIFLYRVNDIYKKISFKIDLKQIALSTFILILEILILYYVDFLTIIPVLILIILNYKRISFLVGFIKNRGKSID
ncbi:lipopolysaccharide biosynthesis protein [Streptococcus pluranimalium]